MPQCPLVLIKRKCRFRTWTLIRQSIYPSIYPSIHPSSNAYLGSGREGSSLSRESQTSQSPATLSSSSGGFRGIPKPAKRKHVLGLPGRLLPMGRALNTSSGRPPVGILIRCPNPLWLLWARSSAGFPTTPLQVSLPPIFVNKYLFLVYVKYLNFNGVFISFQ